MDIKNILGTLTSSLGIAYIYKYLRIKATGIHIVVLSYHRVCNKEDKWSQPGVTLLEFERQMQYLKKNYTLLPLEKLLELIENGEIEKIENKQVAAITFDDGYKDNYVNALPILKKYSIPATIFLTSGLIGKDELFWWDKLAYYIYHSKLDILNLEDMEKFQLTKVHERLRCISKLGEKLRQVPEKIKSEYLKEIEFKTGVYIPNGLGKEMMLSWDEVKEMLKWGISIGAHTVNHPVLSKLSTDTAVFEIKESKLEIEKNLGFPVNLFAYPNGGVTDYNSVTKCIVKEAGYKYAFTTGQGLISRTNIKNAYELKRITIENGYGKFKLKLSGMPSDIYRLLALYK